MTVGEPGAEAGRAARARSRADRWRLLALALDPGRLGRRAPLRLSCLPESAADCLIAVPMLRQGEAARYEG